MPKRPLCGRFCFGHLSCVILGLDPGVHCFPRVGILRSSPRMTLTMCKAMSFHSRGRLKRANRREFSTMNIAMRQAHICAATLCLSNAQKNGIFQSSKRMYLLPHPFGNAGDPTPPPKGLPRGQRFSSSHIAVHLFKKPAAPPPAAGFFVFENFALSSGLS